MSVHTIPPTQDNEQWGESLKVVSFHPASENSRPKLPLASLTNGPNSNRPPFLTLSTTSITNEDEEDSGSVQTPPFSKGVKLKLPSLDDSAYIPDQQSRVYFTRSSKLPTLTLPDRREDLKDSYHCESDIFEDIDVQLSFPGGDLRMLRVKMGETVQGIKRHIETNFGIPYSNSALYLDGKHMLDPLSLNDFPSIAQKQTTAIELRVSLSAKQQDEPHVVDPSQIDSIELPGSVRGSVSSATGIRPVFIDVPPEQPSHDQQIDLHDEHQQRRMKFCWLF